MSAQRWYDRTVYGSTGTVRRQTRYTGSALHIGEPMKEQRIISRRIVLFSANADFEVHITVADGTGHVRVARSWVIHDEELGRIWRRFDRKD